MIWISIAGLTLVVAMITVWEWSQVRRFPVRDKAAFVALMAVGWLLAVLLMLFPGLPGPSELVDKVFKPLGKLLE